MPFTNTDTPDYHGQGQRSPREQVSLLSLLSGLFRTPTPTYKTAPPFSETPPASDGSDAPYEGDGNA